MDRRSLTLLMLAAAPGKFYSPVQIQKSMFLLDRQMPRVFDTTSRYVFRPYDYGPFDSDVYREIEILALDGLAEINIDPARAMKMYGASERGCIVAADFRRRLTLNQIEFIRKVSDFVRNLSFSDLVSAIYEAYPDTRMNSIFVDRRTGAGL